MEKWIERKEIYRGKVFSVDSGKVELDDGLIAGRDVVRHSGGVAIVPVLVSHRENLEQNAQKNLVGNSGSGDIESGLSVIFVKQYRIAIEREILEIPAGLIEKGERPAVAARRELIEETGYDAELLVPGPECYASCGFTDERLHIYLAFDLKKAVKNHDVDERIEEVIMPMEEVKKRLAEKGFEDAKTIIGLHEMFRYLDKNTR